MQGTTDQGDEGQRPRLNRKARRKLNAMWRSAQRRVKRRMHRQLRQMRVEEGLPAWKPEALG